MSAPTDEADPAALAPVRSVDLMDGCTVLELGDSVAVATAGRILAGLGAETLFVRRERPLDLVAEDNVARVATQVVDRGKTAILSEAGLVESLSRADVVLVGSEGDRRTALLNDPALLKPGAAVIEVFTPMGDGTGLTGSDLTVSAETAMSWIVGEAHLPPLTLPFRIAAVMAGVTAASAALTAVLSRTGPSPIARVEISERDVVAYLVGMRIPNFLPYGRPWAREGSRPPGSAGVYPCGLFPCADGMVALYVRSNAEWRALVAAMGNPEWSTKPEMQDAIEIAEKHADEADSHLIPWLEERSRSELAAIGAEFDIPLAAVRSLTDVLSDEQFAFRGTFEDVAADAEEALSVPAVPWRILERRGVAATPALRRSWPARPDSGGAPRGPLDGLRVLDFSWVWSGPMVGAMLVDLGADVIKVESSGRLESLRSRGRPRAGGKLLEGPISELGPWFNQLNHDKRSIDVDIKSEHGRALIRELVAGCDVVIENMRPGAMDRAGLGYRELSAINPAVSMLSMSMCGQTGPLSGMKGYAGIMTAMAGLDGLVGYPADEDAGLPPNVIGMAASALGDPNGALFALPPLLAAVDRARRTGRGAWIDLAQVDAVVSLLTSALIEHQLHGSVAIRGNAHPLRSPHGHYRCAGDDAWVAIDIETDAQWRALIARAGTSRLDALAGWDARARVAHRHEVDEALEEWTRSSTADAVVAVLTSAGVRAAAVASYERMISSSWFAAARLSNRTEHPYLGEQDIYLLPWCVDGRVVTCDRPGPLLGADTDAVDAWYLSLASEGSEHVAT